VGMRHPPRTLAVALALILAACGDGATAGREGELRATVGVKYSDVDYTLVFRPGELRSAPSRGSPPMW
jgi:hypothetical protein